MCTTWCILILFINRLAAAAEPKHPVILVPGDGGSQLIAKLDKPEVRHYLCTKKTSYWFNLWLNLELVAPYLLDCFADNLRLVYNASNHRTQNSPGVQIRVANFGDTDPVEWLDPTHFYETSYFYYIAQDLVTNHGYVRGSNIRGAPFDFRKGPNELGQFYKNLTSLIQETFAKCNNTPVVLVAHSYGNPVLLYYLQKQSSSWKQKYIKSWVCMAGPLAGAAKVVRLMISGDNLSLYPINPLKARIQQRSMPSSAILLPYEPHWNSHEVVASRPGRNYTVRDYRQLFADLNYTDGWLMRRDQEPFLQKLSPPGVEVHCLHGAGVKTPASFSWTSSSWPDAQPTTHLGDGDGTVNMRSLLACLNWKGKQKPSVFHKQIPGTSHTGILSDAVAINYISKLLTTP